MAALLPSEVARLVLGYLEEVNCMEAYNEFLNGCRHLDECRGRNFLTEILGMSLLDMLEDYCQIYSYINSYKCDNELKSKLSKCLNTLEKIKLIFEFQSFSTDNVIGKKPAQSYNRVFEAHNLSTFKKNRPRYNSCDSVVTVNTEKSHVCYMHSPVKKHNEKVYRHYDSIYPSRSAEILIESTNLADLPGNKSNNENKSSQFRGKDKEQTVDDFAYSYENKNNCDKKTTNFSGRNSFIRDETNKSSDQITTMKNVSVECDKVDFRHALGLIKHSELTDRPLRTPAKRKSTKIKSALPSLKKNFETALLDWPELHEKIANNINQMMNNKSLDQTDGNVHSKTEKDKTDMPLLRDSNKSSEVIIIDDDTQQMDGVIKAIVEKTEKDPIFDQLVNEVLALAPSASGSDSDIMSRPETSTPEKSHASLSNVGSSVSSNSENNAEPSKDDIIKKRLWTWKPNQLEIKNIEKDEATNEISKEYYTDNKNMPELTPMDYIVHKKYPRRTRGGKKMDVLRDNYETLSKFEGSNESSVLSDTKRSEIEETVISPPCDQKIIIISNERVHTNIISNHGEIIIQDSDKPVQNKYVEQSFVRSENEFLGVPKENEGPQKKMIDSKNSIPSLNIPLATSLTQVNPASKADFTNNSVQNGNIKYDCVQRNKNLINFTSQTSVKESDVKTGDNSISNQMLFPIGYMDVPTLVSESNDLSSGNAFNPATLRNYRHKIITGKPPELVISNNHTNLVEHSLIPVSSGLFTEGKILDNPTVIMYKPDVSGGLGEPISKPCQIINTMKLPLTETKTTISKKSEGIKILPKLQGIVGFSHIYPCEQYDAGKQNIEIKFVDHEGLDVIPIELCSTEMSDNVTNPRLQKNDNLTNSSSEINEKVSLNSENHKNIDECDTIIIDMKNDNSDNNLQGNDNSMKNFDISELFNNTLNETEKLKTPNNGTAKKMCSSTPSKKYSHIRVLDFNTPLNNVKKRRAMTSPKSILHNQSRTQTSSNSKISSAIKSRLFSPLYEESVDKSQSMGTENTTLSSLNANSEMKCDDTKSIGVELKNNEINGPCPVKSIDKPKKKINSNTSKKSLARKRDVHLNTNKRNNNFSIDSGKCWDKDLRALVAIQDIEKSSKKSIKPTMKSVEDVGKLLEDALLDQPPKIKKMEENSNNGIKIRRSKGELKASSDDISTVADDLELSTNTTTEDINSTQNMLSNDMIIDNCNQSKNKSEVDNIVSNYKQKSSFSKSKTPNLENKRDSSHKKSLKNDKVRTKSTNKTKVAINTKKTTKTKPFKVKISSKTLTGNSNKKNASNESLNLASEAAKLSKGEIQSNARNKCIDEDLTNSSQVSKFNSKEEAELEIPKSSQITPEFPRELRPNPINVKCNLQSFLETPYKSNLLNMSSMATPKFLSPNDNEPISTIKVLGFPTPKFGVTPEGCSNPKCTPSSFSPKNAGYSSCSSYYKPDEVEELNKETFYSVAKRERDKSPILKRTVKKVSPKLQNVSRSVSPKLSNTRKKVSSRLNNRERKVSPKLKEEEFETKAFVNTRVLRPRRCANVFTSESPITEKAVNIKKKKLTNDEIMDAQDCAVSSAKENVLFDSSSSYSSDTTDSDYSFSGSECSDTKSPNFDTKLCSSTPYPYKVEIDNKKPVKSMPKILPQVILQNLEEKRVRIVSKIKNDLSNKKNNTKRQPRALVTNSNRKSSLINMNTAARRDKLNRPKNIKAIPACPDTINKKTTFNLIHKSDEKSTLAVAKSRRKSATPRKLESKEHDKLQITSLDFPPNISILIDRKISPAKEKDILVHELPVKSRFQMNLENEGFDSQAAKTIEDQLMGKDTEVSEAFMNSFEKPILLSKKDSTMTLSISQGNTIVENLINNDKGDINEQKSIELPMPTIAIQETTLTAEVNNEPNIISDNEEDLVVWSEYESDVSNTFTYVYDSNQKKKKPSKKTPVEDFNIDNYALNVNISDNLLDRDQACVLTATEFISTFELSPDPKLRKRKLLLEAKLLKKLAKSSINTKKKDGPRQCVNVEMSNSNSETTLPIKKKLVKFNDADKVDIKEVENQSTNLLKKGEEKIIDSVTTHDKNLVNESSKKNDACIDGEKSEIENIIQFMNSSNDSVNRLDDEMMNFAITGDVREKRKREDDTEDSDAKKPKTFLNEAVDIEKILTVLHGPENCS